MSDCAVIYTRECRMSILKYLRFVFSLADVMVRGSRMEILKYLRFSVDSPTCIYIYTSILY